MPKAPKHKAQSVNKGAQLKQKPATKSKFNPGPQEIASSTRVPRGPLLTTYHPDSEELDSGDQNIPVPRDEREFRDNYTTYAKMRVLDRATDKNWFGEEFIRINDFIEVRSGEVAGKDVEGVERWFGQVREIGSRKEPGWTKEDVCLQVAWFYDREMLDPWPLSKEDRKSCSNMMANEIIPSDHNDIVHLACVLDRVDVTFFDEHAQNQLEIGPEELFYRRRLKAGHLIMSRDTCTPRCKAIYSPLGDIQRYCSRKKCGRWYHTSCMTPGQSHQDDYRLIDYTDPPIEQRIVELVSFGLRAKTPDTKTLAPYPANSSETELELDSETSPVPSSDMLSLVQLLPPRIRELAASAITRGKRSGNGIVGNAWVVMLARQIAYEVIVEKKPMSTDQITEICGIADQMNGGAGVKLEHMKFECPTCKNPI